jgi:hypothetical protein
MRSKASIFSLSANFDSLTAGAVGFLIIQLFSRYSGIGVSPDSVAYLSSARHLLGGKGLTAFDAMPLVDFPAGYPAFLSFLSFVTRQDPLVFGAVGNGLMFAALLYLCGSLMNGFSFHSHWYKLVVLGCFVVSPCLLEIYSMLWSETLFLLLIVLFIPVYKKYTDTHALKWLIWSAAIVATACITRYAGIMMVGAGCLLILLDKETGLREKVRHGFIFFAVSVSLLIVNLIRNKTSGGMVTGARQKGIKTLWQNVIDFGGVICDWLSIDRTDATAVLLTVFVLTLFAVAVIWIFHRTEKMHSYEYIAAVIGSVYCLFMLLSATLSRYEQFTNRLLSPLFIPLIWTLSFRIPALIIHPVKKFRLTGIALGTILTVVLIPIQLSADIETYDGVKDAGIPGYTEDPFPQSDIVQYIEKNKGRFKTGYRIYSNAGDAVYFFTGLTGHILPQYVFPAQVQRYYGEGHNYLIWFNDVDNPDLVDKKTILLHKRLTLLQQFQDGSIYMTPDASE